MKISIKKINTAGFKEWLILLDEKTIGVVFTKKDAKCLVKCLKKNNKK